MGVLIRLRIESRSYRLGIPFFTAFAERIFSVKLLVRCLLLMLPIALPLFCTEEPEQVRSIRIPRVTRAPKLDDFLNNTPREAEAKITDFRQIDPGDGDPVS
jgi:hypothetical protein